MYPEFEVHKMNAKGIEKASHVANAFANLLDELESIIGGPSREMSIVRTKLEEACFFAKKAMANNLANQDLSK